MRSNEYFEAVKSHLEKEGFTEDITEANFVVPQDSDYVDFGEETEEWDIAADRPGLWENIRRKKQREGDNYKPAKPGDPDRPTPDQLKRAQGPCKCSDETTEALQYGKPPKNVPKSTRKGKDWNVDNDTGIIRNDKGDVTYKAVADVFGHKFVTPNEAIA